MGSAIACAADELVMDENAVMMIHQPWTMVMGNQNDLRKEANTLDLLAKTLIAVYKSKFPSKTEDEIAAMMDAETWILATEAEQYGLVCEIDHTVTEPLKIAAKWNKQFKNFKKLPEVFNMKNEEKIEEEKVEETVKKEEVSDGEETKTPEETKEEVESNEEVKSDEKSEDPDEDDVEELRKTIEILKEENEALKNQLAECEKEKEAKETVSKAECEKRVSGMQASMQKQINDFKDQLKVKEEELMKAQADVTRLNESLEQSAKELSETASILAEKTTALERLNANVNFHAEEVPTMKDGLAKCATPAEKVAFLKSGKYVK